MNGRLRRRHITCSSLVALALLSGCMSGDPGDQMMASTARSVNAPLPVIPTPEPPPDPEIYRAIGFDDREAWVKAVLSIAQQSADSKRDQGPDPADTYRLPNILVAEPTSQRLSEILDGTIAGAIGGDMGAGDAVNLEAKTAAPLGYARARRILDAHPWLRDARTAHLHPAVLADALDGMNTHNILRGSLDRTDETSPTVWPPIDIGGRYTAEEVARLKQNAVQIVSRSNLPHWAIFLAQLFHASPDAVNLYVASTPTHADIVHRETGERYGVTGNDLTVSRATLAQLEVRELGYAPCRVHLEARRSDTIYRCDLEPLTGDAAPRDLF